MIIKPKGWNEANTYLLGVLNSKLVRFWLYHRGKKQGDQLQIDKNPLKYIPIRKIEFTDPNDKVRHDRMTKLVINMQERQKRLVDITTPNDIIAFQRQVDAIDRQIDQLVFELYGLIDDEIQIVEQATPEER